MPDMLNWPAIGNALLLGLILAIGWSIGCRLMGCIPWGRSP